MIGFRMETPGKGVSASLLINFFHLKATKQNKMNLSGTENTLLDCDVSVELLKLPL